MSTNLLLLLGVLFPIVFTSIGPSSLLEFQIFLALIVTEWAALRLVYLFGSGEPRLVQTTFWIFVYVWLGLAALAGTVADRFPILNQSFSSEVQARALLTILVGLAAYEVGVRDRKSIPSTKLARWLTNRSVNPRRVVIVAVVGLLGTAFALWRHGIGIFFRSRYSVVEAIYGQPDPGLRLDQIGNKAVGLFQATLIWAPAFVALLLLLMVRARRGSGTRLSGRALSPPLTLLLLIGLAIANLMVNNPISSPRYRFGGVALSLVAVAWPLVRPRRYRLWGCGLLAAILFALPMFDVFRYDDRKMELAPLRDQLLTSPDFAMFQQEMNAQLYVDEHGFTMGEQVLGVVLGYVPRALWPGKPIDTGNVIVRTDAINASASLWATVYIDGGLVLVGLAFLAYGRVSQLFETLYIRRHTRSSFVAAAVPLYASFQIILLRGDLQPAVGQLAPLLVILLFVTRAHRAAVDRSDIGLRAGSPAGSSAQEL
ncbi:MAG TPA: hypothetical protein VGR26_11880 [Acidimicrobiales bacterium]|nr:hypothetical protein [Acidimicrobiales bacterium]